MKMKKLTALLLATLMVLSLAACGAKGDSKTENSGDTAQTEEAAATHKSLMDRENEILSENTELWEKVFLAADKGMAMIEDGKNYGDFLLDTIESAKDQFSDEEYALLKKSAQEISEIENKLTELEKQHPEILNEETDANGDVQKFPSFEGKDLDGNEVKSDELFSANAVTVVNFWFTTCSPCVGELGDLDALNKELADKGGALIGVNAFTLDGDETAISDAKDVLAKKGATYQNVYFDSRQRGGSLYRQHLRLSPPPMWWIGTATSWVSLSWVPSPRRIRRRRCNPSSIRPSPPTRAEKSPNGVQLVRKKELTAMQSALLYYRRREAERRSMHQTSRISPRAMAPASLHL